jgi:hypothetical protein
MIDKVSFSVGAVWLDPDLTDLAKSRDLVAAVTNLAPQPYPVSRKVDRVRDHGPELLQPTPEQRRGVGGRDADPRSVGRHRP